MVLGSMIGAPVASLALLAFLVLERGFELALSRANLRGRSGTAAGSRLEWGAMVGLHAALLVLPPIELATAGSRPPNGLVAVSILAVLAAQSLRAWCLVTLGRAWNARAVVDPSQAVVDRGPYRWIRHPNYLAVLIEFAAIPLAFGAWRAWIVLNLLHVPLIVRRIRAEERLLRALPDYAERMGHKGRLFPRLARSHSVREVS